MRKIDIYENGIYMNLEVTEENEIKLLHFSALPFRETDIVSRNGKLPFTLAELLVSGLDRQGQRHGSNYVRTAPGYRMKFRDFRDIRNEKGRLLEVITYDEPTGLELHNFFQFYTDIAVVRAWSEVLNIGTEAWGIEYISSFALTGIGKEGIEPADKKLKLYIPYNGWQKELHWQEFKFEELGMSTTQVKDYHRSSKTIGIGNTGNWSTKEYLPMGFLYNEEMDTGLYWQIENNGSWYWEISDQDGQYYLKLSGPTEAQSHWWKNLKPGERFISVPVAVGVHTGGFDEGMVQLTMYRRQIRRQNQDNIKLPVIFNDYMNCLFGDPTTAKELPLIDRAKEIGCEYYCIDCGWYSKGHWWDNVGEWIPSNERFPNGIKALLQYIREKGMIPGLWLEIEVMGIKCPKADKVSNDWYFTRHGKRVYDRSRYQLDFRNPEVIKHANEVIDRLVQDYGVGYIKMDYNIEPGIGTERDADSFGDGLLQHNRAYLAWLDQIFEKYPDLIIENCSSGGMRMDYAMLSRHSIQSTSDQEDYLKYATISANACSALTPEQAAVWSYPMENGDEEETIFNMVNVMLLRIHQSGQLVNMSAERIALISEGIQCYKEIRGDIKRAFPRWPIGLSHYNDSWNVLNLQADEREYIAVWRRSSDSEYLRIPMPHLKEKEAVLRCIYPNEKKYPCEYQWKKEKGEISVRLSKENSARLFKIEIVN